jgi:two-component system chemotaxis response regulator CheY
MTAHVDGGADRTSAEPTGTDPGRETDIGPAAPPVVLVVDDAATVRAYHRAILTEAGFAVREACNGYEGLELTLAERFELLVVDVNMPVMDGYAFVEAVRQEALVPDVPVIVISTEQTRGDSEEAYRNGANMYLVKPVQPHELVLTAQVLTGRLAGTADGRR